MNYLIIAGIILISLLFWFFLFYMIFYHPAPQTAPNEPLERQDSAFQENLPITQGNSLISMSYLPEPINLEVRGSVISNEESPVDILERKIRNMPLLNKIIDCESNWKIDAINQKCGYQCGMGLTQLIPSRVKDCSHIFGRQINPLDKFDNLQCGLYLFEKDGYKHWGYNGAEWGSFNCFKNWIN